MRMPRAFLALPLLLACKEEGGVAWAVHHATVDALAEGAHGYQVWEFYSSAWGDEKDADDHLCSRVQSVDGVAAAPVSGCTDCEVTFAVIVEDVQTDCEGEEGTGPGYGSMTHFAMGPLPEELAKDAPYGEDTYGWYMSWDGLTIEPYGYVWNERLDKDEPLLVRGWAPGERYVFWPAYAWEL